MVTNGKQKGGRGEREVQKIFQEYWRKIEPLTELYRTPGSGAWATQRNANSMQVAADIMHNPSTCKRWPFSIECKFRKTITERAIENFSKGRKSSIIHYWNQAKEAAKKDGLRPVLVFRGNRMTWRVALILEDNKTPEYTVLTIDEFLKIDPEVFALPLDRSAPTGDTNDSNQSG